MNAINCLGYHLFILISQKKVTYIMKLRNDRFDRTIAKIALQNILKKLFLSMKK